MQRIHGYITQILDLLRIATDSDTTLTLEYTDANGERQTISANGDSIEEVFASLREQLGR
jgi:hypothetical protein